MIPLAAARRLAARVLGQLARNPSALRLGVSAGVRCMEPEVEHFDIIATALEPEALEAAFDALDFLPHPDCRVGLIALEAHDGSYWAILALASSAGAHTQALRESLPKDLLDLPAVLPSEQALYEHVGLPWLPPELRYEGAPPAPDGLVAMPEIRGVAGLQTTAGEGRHGATLMVERARREGFAWAVLADTLPDAGAARAQRAEVGRASAALAEDEAPLHVFLAAVVTPSPAGRPLVAPELADAVDMLVLDASDTPEGAAAALSDPGVKVLAHPRAPCVWARDPEAWLPLMDAAATHHVALEVSGCGAAAVLPPGWSHAAQERGLPVLASAGAQDVAGIEDVVCAVGALRRGAWTAPHVLSTQSADGFAAWLAGTSA